MSFHRIAHLQFKPTVHVGAWVIGGRTVVGNVGSTGVSTGPHVHHDATWNKPVNWHQYKSRPLREYMDTASFAPLVLPYPNRFFTNRHGVNGHRGVDINVGPEDLGLPVYAPVTGRVVFVEKPVSVYRIYNRVRVLMQPTWGSGFGNFLWIEEAPPDPIEIELLNEAKKTKAIYNSILQNKSLLVDAVKHKGFSITDVINSYYNEHKRGKQIFDFSKQRHEQ